MPPNTPTQAPPPPLTTSLTRIVHFSPRTDVTRSPWLALGFTLGVVLLGSGPLCNDENPVLDCRTGSLRCPKSPSCFPSPLSLLVPNPLRPLFFSLPPEQPFPGYHVAGIRQQAALSEGLLSLRNMHLGFLHVFSRLESSRFSCIYHRTKTTLDSPLFVS